MKTRKNLYTKDALPLLLTNVLEKLP